MALSCHVTFANLVFVSLLRIQIQYSISMSENCKLFILCPLHCKFRSLQVRLQEVGLSQDLCMEWHNVGDRVTVYNTSKEGGCRLLLSISFRNIERSRREGKGGKAAAYIYFTCREPEFFVRATGLRALLCVHVSTSDVAVVAATATAANAAPVSHGQLDEGEVAAVLGGARNLRKSL